MITSTHRLQIHTLAPGLNQVELKRGSEIQGYNGLTIITLEPIATVQTERYHFYVFSLDRKVDDELAANLQFCSLHREPGLFKSELCTIWRDRRYPQRRLRALTSPSGS